MTPKDDAPRAPWPPPDDRRRERDETRRRQRRHTRLVAAFTTGGALLLVVSVAVAYQLGQSNEPSSTATHEALGTSATTAPPAVTSSAIPTAPATAPPPIQNPPKAKMVKKAKVVKPAAKKPLPKKVTSENPDGSNPTATTGTGFGVAVAPAVGGKRPLTGKVIAIDPGHNPGNARYASEVNRPVLYDGAHTKPCDTTGTDTRSGYPEYAYTWDVASRVVAILRAEGAKVYLTRTATTPAWGPCIGDRAALGNRVRADAAVSIHGDGGPDSGHGFESIVPEGPIATAGLTSTMVANDLRLAEALRAAFSRETGMVYSTYLGSEGIYRSNYYGGIDLSKVPKTLIETGNMRNDADAALMESPAWRAKAAAGIALGITRFVLGS